MNEFGSLKKIGYKVLNKAKLKDRIGIKLKNPLLPEETPLSDSSLWYLNL